jgi:hypothetical protein
MSTITVAAITVNAVTGVATTAGPMVTLIGTTPILIIILIFILIIILILCTALVVGTVGVVGVGKGATVVAAKRDSIAPELRVTVLALAVGPARRSF